MALDTCPECHVSFEGLTGEEVLEHRNHWPDEIPFPRTNAEAVKRSDAIVKEADSRKRAELRGNARKILAEEGE